MYRGIYSAYVYMYTYIYIYTYINICVNMYLSEEWRPPGDYACPGEPEDVFRARMIALREWIAERPEKGRDIR
jgi:hypothetical protein